MAAPGISANGLEITIFETPRHARGIRGLPGDELSLSYRVDDSPAVQLKR